jgi:signal transduction histidine kinase/ActR/RegA family two-component response regulator
MKNAAVGEKIQLILRFVAYTLVTGIVGTGVLIWVAEQASLPNQWMIAGWASVNLLNLVARYAAFVRIKRQLAYDTVSLARHAWLHTFFSGCMWGVAALLFIPTLSPNYQLVFAMVMLSLNYTSVPLMSDRVGIATLFLPAWLLAAVAFRLANGTWSASIGIAFLLGTVFVVATVIQRTLDGYIDAKVKLRSALKEEETSKALQQAYFIGASHDFREPLQVIMFCAVAAENLAKQGVATEPVMDRLDDAFESMTSLIDETISFARVSMGLKAPSIVTVCSTDFSTPLREYFSMRAKKKGIEFRLHNDQEIYFKADAKIVLRVLRNLISNAFNHTKSGGILVAFRKHGNHCRVEVWDTGCGIMESDRSRIFEEFYQVNANRGSAFYGDGLGLSIVKRLCAYMGSTIDFSSRVNKGTVFRFDLPLADAPSTAIQRIEANSGRLVDLRGKTIAIVENNQELLDSFSIYLKSAGAQVVCALTFTELLDNLEDVRNLNMLVADFHLANENDLLDADLVKTRFPRSKRLVLTGRASANAKIEMIEKGFTVVTKPISPPDLLSIIAETLNHHTEVAEASCS